MDIIYANVGLGAQYPAYGEQEKYIFRLDGMELKRVLLSETSSFERTQASMGGWSLVPARYR